MTISADIYKNRIDSERLQFLLLEPDSTQNVWLKKQLQSLDADVRIPTGSRRTELNSLIDRQWHLIVLDAKWFGSKSLELCRYLRLHCTTASIIFIASENEMNDGLLSLEFGADDCLSKPINPLELQARIKALLRRRGNQFAGAIDDAAIISYKDFSLNKDSRDLMINGTSIVLTSREFDLIWLLANNPNKVFSRSELLDKVWGYNHSGYEQTVNSHVNRLRNKLRMATSKSKFLETVWGIGYRFRVA